VNSRLSAGFSSCRAEQRSCTAAATTHFVERRRLGRRLCALPHDTHAPGLRNAVKPFHRYVRF
jgi:hypothetical protein